MKASNNSLLLYSSSPELSTDSNRSYSSCTEGLCSMSSISCSCVRSVSLCSLSKFKLLHSLGCFSFFFPRHKKRFLYYDMQHYDFFIYLSHKDDSIQAFRFKEMQFENFVIMPMGRVCHRDSVTHHTIRYMDKVSLQVSWLSEKKGNYIIIVIFNVICHRLKNNRSVIFLQ